MLASSMGSTGAGSPTKSPHISSHSRSRLGLGASLSPHAAPTLSVVQEDEGADGAEAGQEARGDSAQHLPGGGSAGAGESAAGRGPSPEPTARSRAAQEGEALWPLTAHSSLSVIIPGAGGEGLQRHSSSGGPGTLAEPSPATESPQVIGSSLPTPSGAPQLDQAPLPTFAQRRLASGAQSAASSVSLSQGFALSTGAFGSAFNSGIIGEESSEALTAQGGGGDSSRTR